MYEKSWHWIKYRIDMIKFFYAHNSTNGIFKEKTLSRISLSLKSTVGEWFDSNGCMHNLYS